MKRLLFRVSLSRLLFSITVVLVTARVLGYLVEVSPNTSARATTGTIYADVGNVLPGAVVEHEFTISNHSQAAWTILGTDRTCGCTDVYTQNRHILPGESAPVKVTVKIPNRIGRFATEAQLRIQELTSSIKMQVVAQIHSTFEIQPEYLQIDSTSDSAIGKFSIISQLDAVPTISGPAWCKCSITNAATNSLGSHWDVETQVDASTLKESESMRGEIRVSLPGTEAFVMVPIRVNKGSIFRLFPPQLLFQRPEPNGQLTAQLLIVSDPKSPALDPKEFVFELDMQSNIVVTSVSIKQQGIYQLKITASDQQFARGTATISHSKLPSHKIRIPVYIAGTTAK